MSIRIAIDDDAAGAVADDYACFDDNGSKWLITACDCLVLHPDSLRDEELFKLGERQSLRAKVQYARNPASNECDELAPPHGDAQSHDRGGQSITSRAHRRPKCARSKDLLARL
jgi:hypothetical protein